MDGCVRITVDIDADVLAAVRERARRQRASVGRALSDLARQALTEPLPDGRESDELLGFRPFPSRGGIVTSELIDSLREDDPGFDRTRSMP